MIDWYRAENMTNLIVSYPPEHLPIILGFIMSAIESASRGYIMDMEFDLRNYLSSKAIYPNT